MTIRVSIPDAHWIDRSVLLDDQAWGRVLDIIRAEQLLDDATIARLANPAEDVSIPREQALKIGSRLFDTVFDAMKRKPAPPPKPPAYIVPIATSNGVWIDPALGPIRQWLEAEKNSLLQLTCFSFFCQSCTNGITVNREA